LPQALLHGFQAGEQPSVLLNELKADPGAQDHEEPDDQPGKHHAEQKYADGHDLVPSTTGMTGGLTQTNPVKSDGLALPFSHDRPPLSVPGIQGDDARQAVQRFTRRQEKCDALVKELFGVQPAARRCCFTRRGPALPRATVPYDPSDVPSAEDVQRDYLRRALNLCTQGGRNNVKPGFVKQFMALKAPLGCH
jgi:hypothetical protein